MRAPGAEEAANDSVVERASSNGKMGATTPIAFYPSGSPLFVKVHDMRTVRAIEEELFRCGGPHQTE